ncbi:MAG TPA: hypothetical protein ENJ93_09640 [Chloroflexi bacterium]|nr:hypothetical protein [Chloroflexota bacterium]
MENLYDLVTTEIVDRPIKWSTTIFDLGEEEYDLVTPLSILIEEYGENDVIARFPELEISGIGGTDAEAIQNLKHAILDFYDELTETDPDTLGKLPQMWLRILTKLIHKTQPNQ